MVNRILMIVAALLLAGCMSAPVAPAAPALASPPGSTSVLCTLVSTLTATVRTVLLQVGADAPAGSVETGEACTIKMTRREGAAAPAPAASAASAAGRGGA